MSYMQFLIETILFFLSGTIMGDVLSKFGSDSNEIYYSDIFKTIVLYFFLILSRTIMMLILYIPLKHTGDKLNIKEAIVIVWGGLRGALAIALGLIVFSTKSDLSLRTKDLVIFHITCQVFLTLVINGTTTSWVLD